MREPTIAGTSVPRVDGLAKVTGNAKYTLDLTVPGMTQGVVVRADRAHARIVSIDRTAALQVPGVVAVFTHEDAPAQHFSTAQHELYTDDPDDTRVLDAVVRCIGQRVAAGVAASVGAAVAGARARRGTSAAAPRQFCSAIGRVLGGEGGRFWARGRLGTR